MLIKFLPPPMDGEISLGIFDANGHLVRTLKREADVDDFVKGDDGLIAYWDRKDDAGNPVPAGKYYARGFTVGDMDFDGIDTLGNDWFTDDDSPRIRRIDSTRTDTKGELVINAQLVDGKTITFKTTSDGNISSDKTGFDSPGYDYSAGVHPDEKIIDETSSSTGLWRIVRIKSTGAIEVRENGKFLRQLTIKPNDPQPIKIAASPDGNTIYLLEQNDKEQRLRGLQLESDSAAKTASPNPPTASATPLTTNSDSVKSSPTPAPSASPASSPLASGTNSATAASSPGGVKISKWRVVFSKTITFSDDFDAVKSLLFFPDKKPFTPVSEISVKLRANPLREDKTQSIVITAGFDANGSFLRTTDGLELARISDTPNLKWVRIGQPPGSRAITIFQSDGAVIEEYGIDKLANMMSFNAGEYTVHPKAAAPSPTPAPSASPTASPTR